MDYVGGEKELTFFPLTTESPYITFLILLKRTQAHNGTCSFFSIPNISEISMISYMKAFNAYVESI